jgi:mannose-6-phosphate isomerase-like protein (cupin superfamily)
MSDDRLHIVSDLPRYKRIDGHYAPAALYLSPSDHPGVPVSIAAVDAALLLGTPLSDQHIHPCDEIYLAITPGLRFAVETDKDITEVISPASVRVPAGVPHRFLVRQVATAPCIFLGVLLGAE